MKIKLVIVLNFLINAWSQVDSERCQRTGRDIIYYGRQRGEKRIINGVVGNIKDAPHSALLQYKCKPRCMGVIIHQRWVLTSYSCTQPKKDPMTVETTTIRIGSNISTWGGISYNISKIVHHPSYKRNTPANDLGLVKTKETIQMGDLVKKANMFKWKQYAKQGWPIGAIMASFGPHVKNETQSQHLRFAHGVLMPFASPICSLFVKGMNEKCYCGYLHTGSSAEIAIGYTIDRGAGFVLDLIKFVSSTCDKVKEIVPTLKPLMKLLKKVIESQNPYLVGILVFTMNYKAKGFLGPPFIALNIAEYYDWIELTTKL